MFLKKLNIATLTTFKSHWFSLHKDYSFYVYEDVFIRKYISSFLQKFNKHKKIIGSILIFRTFGKLYIKVLFYNALKKKRFFIRHKKIKRIASFKFSKKYPFFWKKKIKPINKYKKQLIFLKVFYNLEYLLKYQVFYKLINTYNIVSLKFKDKVIHDALLTNLKKYKSNNSEDFFFSLVFFKKLFSFKTPDSQLLATYINYKLRFLYRHTFFISFVHDALKLVCSVYNHVLGIKLIVSGKINRFNRARTKKIQIGRIPVQELTICSTYGFSEVFTAYGKLGIKVWVFLSF